MHAAAGSARHSHSGSSGAHLTRLVERWGIVGAIAERIVQAPPGVPVGTLIASGKVELGFQQSSELMHVAGIDVIGVLPPEIQVTTIFSAAICTICTICTASAQREAARALLTFLASPDADSAKQAHGMEPA